MSDLPVGLDIFRTELPMRAFDHAAARRSKAEAIVVRLRSSAGGVGWGEALPRAYVTGETFETVIDDIAQIFWPVLRACKNQTEIADAVMNLPRRDGDRVITAARCAVELAAIQALRISWYGDASADVSRPTPRVTGVLGSADPAKTKRLLRRMRLYGLRHFKLKLGFDDAIDQANLAIVHQKLKRYLDRGVCSLRVDANSAWKYKDVVDRVDALTPYGVCAVEQPCKAQPNQLVDLAYKCSIPLIADESCLLGEQAELLFGAEGRVWLNLRLAKNGGLAPVLRMAQRAAEERVPFILGCLVGESAILSRAQRALLAVAPAPWAIEGSYGRFLLRDDLTVPSPRFGYGGRLIVPPTGDLNCRLRSDKLDQYGRLARSLD